VRVLCPLTHGGRFRIGGRALFLLLFSQFLFVLVGASHPFVLVGWWTIGIVRLDHLSSFVRADVLSTQTHDNTREHIGQVAHGASAQKSETRIRRTLQQESEAANRSRPPSAKGMPCTSASWSSISAISACAPLLAAAGAAAAAAEEAAAAAAGGAAAGGMPAAPPVGAAAAAADANLGSKLMLLLQCAVCAWGVGSAVCCLSVSLCFSLLCRCHVKQQAAAAAAATVARSSQQIHTHTDHEAPHRAPRRGTRPPRTDPGCPGSG
jgi:hypothetical protein